MRNLYYTYHVAHKMRPADVKDFKTLKEVQEYTKLSLFSIYENLRNGYHIKGWIITKIPIPRPEKPKKAQYNKGVIAYLPDGEVRHFRTQRECAEALGVSESTVFKCLKDEKADYMGNEYDYPL